MGDGKSNHILSFHIHKQQQIDEFIANKLHPFYFRLSPGKTKSHDEIMSLLKRHKDPPSWAATEENIRVSTLFESSQWFVAVLQVVCSLL